MFKRLFERYWGRVRKARFEAGYNFYAGLILRQDSSVPEILYRAWNASWQNGFDDGIIQASKDWETLKKSIR